jgi:ABC-type dipeptide/oligopeptide/nickel transport system ATPase component
VRLEQREYTSVVADSPVLQIDDLAVAFHTGVGRHSIRAVDGLSLTIHAGQTLAVVGESGCGKSVTAMSVLQLNPCPPARYERGAILFGGRDLLSLSEREMRTVRGGKIAMIFQEPMTSLNPVFTIGEQIEEAARLHRTHDSGPAMSMALEAMREVGLPDPQRLRRAFPHQLSGGMRQRAMIAMALVCQPRLLLADEPTTALDVTIQEQVLTLLRRLQIERGLGIMLITHSLGVVAGYADVVCVMYAGRVVEYSSVVDLFDRPLHPYTRGLLRSTPSLRDRRARLATIDEVVSRDEAFYPLLGREHGLVPWWPGRTPPALVDLAEPGVDSRLVEVEPRHWVACWATPAATALPRSRPDIAARHARGAAVA